MRRFVVVMMIVLMPALASAVEESYVFNHQEHLEEYEEDCTTCHQEGALDIVPSTEICEECHEEEFIREVKIPARKTHDSFWYREHGIHGKKEDNICASCHDDQFCFDCHRAGFADEQGMLNIHRSDYRVTHPISAKADARSCTICHEPEFCVDCHEQFAPEDLAFVSHRRGFSGIPGFGTPHGGFTTDQCQVCHPNSILPSHQWSGQHAREARRALQTCQSCHPKGDVCLKCHSAREGLIVNPHPDNWDDIGDILNGAGGGKTCRRCH